MITTIRRILLVVAASLGVVATTTLTAQAGLSFTNHCEIVAIE